MSTLCETAGRALCASQVTGEHIHMGQQQRSPGRWLARTLRVRVGPETEARLDFVCEGVVFGSGLAPCKTHDGVLPTTEQLKARASFVDTHDFNPPRESATNANRVSRARRCSIFLFSVHDNLLSSSTAPEVQLPKRIHSLASRPPQSRPPQRLTACPPEGAQTFPPE